MWLSRFVAPILGIRELLWFPPKSTNFPKICDTRYRTGKHSKSFPWTCDSAAVNDITANGGITTGRNYRLVWLPEFVTPTCSVRELSRFLSDIVNKGLPKGVLNKHLWLVWLVERSAWIKGTVLQHRATVLPNVGITHISGIISVRAINRILPRNRGRWAG